LTGFAVALADHKGEGKIRTRGELSCVGSDRQTDDIRLARLAYFGSESDDAKLCGCQVCRSRGCLGGVQSPTPFGVENLAITIFDGILGT